MAVLVEAISVVVRADRLLEAYGGNWDSFVRDVPNATLCADGKVARIGFMSPDDTRAFVELLERKGLKYLREGKAVDLVVVDQMRGPLVVCEWIECGHVLLGGDKNTRVAACRLQGDAETRLITPEGWTFDLSLSRSFGFAPSGEADRSLEFLRHEDGMDVYRSALTNEDVFVGRADLGNM